MSRIHKIRIIGSVMVVEGLPGSGLRFFINLEKEIPEISRISLYEECPPDYIARIIIEINSLLVQYSKLRLLY